MFFKSKKSAEKEAEKAAAPPPATADASEPQKNDQALAKKYSRGLIQAFGSVVAVYCRSKFHRGRTLAEIEERVTPAVISGQFSLAEATHKKDGLVTPVAVVLWASVSEAVDRRLSSGTNSRLQTAEWKSGNIVWIVDAVGEKRMLEAMVKRLREKAWKGRLVKVHTRNASGKSSVRILQPAAG